VQPAARPDVDAIFGIPPTVAIEQTHQPRWPQEHGRDADRGSIIPALALLKLGTQYCPTCNVRIEPQSVDSMWRDPARGTRKTSVSVATVLLRPPRLVLCSIATVGGMPKMASTSGRAAGCTNCRAYAFSDSR